MRCAMITLALLGFTAVLSAASPFAGTWKINPAKCKYTAGAPMKEQTIKINEDGSNLEVSVQGTSADGASVLSRYEIPTAGGAGKAIQSPYEGVTTKQLSPRERQNSYTKGGKVVFTVHLVVSPDGKTMTAHVKGTDPAGKPVDGTSFFEKQ